MREETHHGSMSMRGEGTVSGMSPSLRPVTVCLTTVAEEEGAGCPAPLPALPPDPEPCGVKTHGGDQRLPYCLSQQSLAANANRIAALRSGTAFCFILAWVHSQSWFSAFC